MVGSRLDIHAARLSNQMMASHAAPHGVSPFQGLKFVACPGRFSGVSLVVAALIWGLGVGGFAPEARSNGCHAPERPRLGFSNFFENHLNPNARLDIENHRPSAVSPTPCQGETPGATHHFVPTPTALASAWDRLEPRRSVLPMRSFFKTLSPQHILSPLDRPPRSFSV